MTRSDAAPSRILGASALLLGVFSFVTLVAFGYESYSPLPWLDAWNHWNLYLRPQSFASYLFSQHNEHRIPVSRLLYLADLRLVHGDARLLLWCTYLAQAASGVMLYRLARSSFTTTWARAFIAGLVLAYTFAASQWNNFTWTFEICFVLVFCLAIAALTALRNSAPAVNASPVKRAAWLAGAIALGALDTGTMANGLVLWPLLVLMAHCIGLPKRAVGFVAMSGVVTWVAYLSGYRPSSAVTIGKSVAKAPEILVFACAYLGSAVDEPLLAVANAIHVDVNSYRVAASSSVGFAGLAWYLKLATQAVRRRTKRVDDIALLHVSAFLVASAGITALGRVQFPMQDALTSRYVTPSLLFWACLMLLTLGRLWASGEQPPLAAQLAALAAAIFIGGIPQIPKVHYGIEAGNYLREGEYALINDVYSPDVWNRFYPQPSDMIPVVNYFRANHLASFEEVWTDWIGEALSAHFRITPDATCLGAWDTVTRLPDVSNPVVVVQGWAFDRRFNRAPDRIVFTDESGRILGFAPVLHKRPDVAVVHPRIADRRVGWVGYLKAGSPARLTAYLVQGDGAGLCRVGSAFVPPR